MKCPICRKENCGVFGHVKLNKIKRKIDIKKIIKTIKELIK